MPSRRTFLYLVLAAVTSAGSVVAAPVRTSPAGPASKGGAPAEFVSQIDGPIATSTGPDGRTWAAWAYRARGEFDVAVAVRDGSGVWSLPSYLGRRDGLDEVDPAIVVDLSGNVYVAFTSRGSGRISVSALPAGGSEWLRPAVVSGTEQASAPVIRVIGDHVVVAYRTVGGTGMADLAGLGSVQILGIQDGPDGVDPLGLIPRWGGETKQQDPDSPPGD